MTVAELVASLAKYNPEARVEIVDDHNQAYWLRDVRGGIKVVELAASWPYRDWEPDGDNE